LNIPKLKRGLVFVLFSTLSFFLTIYAYELSYARLGVEDELLNDQYSHLQIITEEEHPVLSGYHAKVGDHIVDTIKNTESFQVFEQKGETDSDMGNIEIRNIAAFKKSVQSEETILLSAHYDSETGSFGANDNGVAVASMLAIMKKYDSIDLNKNLLFLFPDAEEQGLAGSRFFLDNIDKSDYGEIEYVFNFEARGAGGPVFMFESVNADDQDVNQLISKVDVVNNHSLATEIYKRLPNDSDLSVFKEIGVPGYNFGYFHGYYAYHTPEDNLQNTSRSTRSQYVKIMENIVDQYALQDIHESRSVLPGSLIHFSVFTGKDIQINSSVIMLVGLTLMTINLFLFRKSILKISFKKFIVESGYVVPSIVSLGILALVLGMIMKFAVFLSESMVLISIGVLFSVSLIVNLGVVMYRKTFVVHKFIVYLVGLLSLLLVQFLYFIALSYILLMISQILIKLVTNQRGRVVIVVLCVLFISLIHAPIVWSVAWILDNRIVSYFAILLLSWITSMFFMFNTEILFLKK